MRKRFDVIWFSSIDGELHTENPDEEGNVSLHIDLTPGDHAITLTVTDTILTSNTSISIAVVDQDDAPTLNCVLPFKPVEKRMFRLFSRIDDVQDAPEDLLVSFQSDLMESFAPIPDSRGCRL